MAADVIDGESDFFFKIYALIRNDTIEIQKKKKNDWCALFSWFQQRGLLFPLLIRQAPTSLLQSNFNFTFDSKLKLKLHPLMLCGIRLLSPGSNSTSIGQWFVIMASKGKAAELGLKEECFNSQQIFPFLSQGKL